MLSFGDADRLACSVAISSCFFFGFFLYQWRNLPEILSLLAFVQERLGKVTEK